MNCFPSTASCAPKWDTSGLLDARGGYEMSKDIFTESCALRECTVPPREGMVGAVGHGKVPRVPDQLISNGTLDQSFYSLWSLFLLWPKGVNLNYPAWETIRLKRNKIWDVL